MAEPYPIAPMGVSPPTGLTNHGRVEALGLLCARCGGLLISLCPEGSSGNSAGIAGLAALILCRQTGFHRFLRHGSLFKRWLAKPWLSRLLRPWAFSTRGMWSNERRGRGSALVAHGLRSSGCTLPPTCMSTRRFTHLDVTFSFIRHLAQNSAQSTSMDVARRPPSGSPSALPAARPCSRVLSHAPCDLLSNPYVRHLRDAGDFRRCDAVDQHLRRASRR